MAIVGDLGADRVMFAADHPFEDMAEGADWFETLPLSERDRSLIARGNAEALLGL